MRVVDANVLLYSVNESAPHHDHSRRWLDSALSGGDSVGFAWIALLAFVRLSTKSGIFAHPLPVEDATQRTDEWLAAPGARIVQPTSAHSRIVAGFLAAVGTGANLVNDAHLAALAVEHHGDVVSFDNDFDRFPEVRWRTPSQLLA